MMIECFLCGEPVPVKETKKGKPWIQCRKCNMRMFVNDDEAIAALETLAVDENGQPLKEETENPEATNGPSQDNLPTPQKSGSKQSLPRDEFATLVAELKKQRAELKALKEAVQASANSESVTFRDYVTGNA
ncbi:MAG: hypothetical protein GTO12_14285 [Proteobacteria bacterium]|nr:hypothetical protein [Pseudomonadota bacterium]